MPFPPIELARVSDARLRKAINDGITVREREITRLEAENARIASVYKAASNDVQVARQDLATARSEVEAGRRKLADQQAQLTAKEVELGKLRQELTVASNATRELEVAKARIAELLGRVDPAKVPRPKMKVDQLVNGLRTQIEGLNAETIRKNVGGSMLVEGCEIEIKGGIDVSEGIQLVTVAESALGANTVSTLRFALRPAPVVRMADDEA